MTRTAPTAARPRWQYRGRCSKCLAKIIGCRRLTHCHCGGRVLYRR